MDAIYTGGPSTLTVRTQKKQVIRKYRMTTRTQRLVTASIVVWARSSRSSCSGAALNVCLPKACRSAKGRKCRFSISRSGRSN